MAITASSSDSDARPRAVPAVRGAPVPVVVKAVVRRSFHRHQAHGRVRPEVGF